jgi:hypothetical protein
MDFKQADEQFKQLKARFATGELSEAKFKAALEDLMVEDESGHWWMIGYETGRWYLHDGADWVLANPPVYVPPAGGTGGESTFKTVETREVQSAEEAERAAKQKDEEERIARAAFQDKWLAEKKAREEAELSTKPKVNPPAGSRPVPRPSAIPVEQPVSPSQKRGGVPLKVLAGLNAILVIPFFVKSASSGFFYTEYLFLGGSSALMAILAYVVSNRPVSSIPAFPNEQPRSRSNQWADLLFKVLLGLEVLIALQNLFVFVRYTILEETFLLGAYWILQAVLILVIANRVRHYSRVVPLAMTALLIIGGLQTLSILTTGEGFLLVNQRFVRSMIYSFELNTNFWLASILVPLYHQPIKVFMYEMLLPSILAILPAVFVFKEKDKYIH